MQVKNGSRSLQLISLLSLSVHYFDVRKKARFALSVGRSQGMKKAECRVRLISKLFIAVYDEGVSTGSIR